MYVCKGLVADEKLPSPKSQSILAMLPLPAVLLLVNCSVKGEHPETTDAVNAGAGAAFTVMYCTRVRESLPAAFCTTNFML